MSDDAANLYRGLPETVQAVDIEKPLAGAKFQACEFYGNAYDSAAAEARTQGREEESRVYSFLWLICSFYQNYGNRERPYYPMPYRPVGKDVSPADLTPADVEVMKALFEKARDPTLKARLGDFLWMRCKNHSAARIAVEQYAISGTRLLETPVFSIAKSEFTRALQLAWILGRDNEPYTSIVSRIEEMIRAIPPGEKSFRAGMLMKVLLVQGAGNADGLVGVAGKHAAENQDDPSQGQAYWEIEAKWLAKAKKTEESRQAFRNAAEALIRAAHAKAEGAVPSHIAGSQLLAQAIEILRQNGEDPARVAALKKTLLEWQRIGMAEMKIFELKIDLTAAAAIAPEIVTADTFDEAVFKLALRPELVDPSRLRVDALKSARGGIAAIAGGVTHVASDGRVLARMGDLSGDDTPAEEDEVRRQMVHYAFENIFTVRAVGFIEPALMAIQRAWKPCASDMRNIVSANPFVPTGHEEIIGRGLLAGFEGDWIMAAHFLAPQVENSIRHVLQQNDVDVSNLMSDLTQPLKISAQIIGHPQAKVILGEDMVFELQALLLEQRGPQIRHAVAHGMADFSTCYSVATVNVWWLFLRLCIFMALYEERKAADKLSEPVFESLPKVEPAGKPEGQQQP